MNNGTMEHLTDTKLQKYQARELSAAETTAVILHLDACPDCFGKLENIPAEDYAPKLFFAGDAEVFHLDYDDHLRPFVDNQAGAATREIVEGHAQTCAPCAFQLRELREFSESLRFRQSANFQGKLSFLAKVRLLLTGLTKRANFQAAAVFLLLMLFGFLAFFTIGKHKTAENIAAADQILPEKQLTSSSSPSIEKTEISDESVKTRSDQSPAEVVVSKDNQPPINEPDKVNKSNRSEKKEVQNDSRESAELGKLPQTLRLEMQQALETRRLNLPPVLRELSSNMNLRGESGLSEPIQTIVSPDNEVVISDRPIFQWRRSKNSNQKFIVEIFDDENNSVAVSPQLNGNSWKPEKSLPRGKIYFWELRTQTSDNAAGSTANGKFKILDARSKAEIEKFPTSAAPLLRGIFLASKGLITEARLEFQKADRRSPRGPAKIFLRQLKK